MCVHTHTCALAVHVFNTGWSHFSTRIKPKLSEQAAVQLTDSAAQRGTGAGVQCCGGRTLPAIYLAPDNRLLEGEA